MGYFEIGIYHTKCIHNIGTLWRSAYQLGASGIFVIGRRFKKQPSDTLKAMRHIPLREYSDFDAFFDARPTGAELVCIEMGGVPLSDFDHPKRAIYLLGAEDHGIPSLVRDKAQSVVSLGSVRTKSYNVAIAGSIVMYHRFMRG